MKKYVLVSIFILLIIFNNCEKQNSRYKPVLQSFGGYLYTLGANRSGVIGDSSETDRFWVYQIPKYSNITQIDASEEVSMALTNTGYVLMWGENNLGQLAYDTSMKKILYPRIVKVIPKAVKIATSGLISAIVDVDSNVWMWGTVYSSGVYSDPLFSSSLPQKVEGLSDIVDVDCGEYHCIALDKNGYVWAWGSNIKGILGDGSTNNRMTPEKVINLSGVKKISAGGEFNLALLNNGEIYSWGYNLHGELGTGETINAIHVPVKVKDVENVIAVSAGSNHSLCLTESKNVYAWGEGYTGELGNNDNEDSNIPIRNTYLNNVEIIDAGFSSSIAVTGDGDFWAWGNYKFYSGNYGYSGYNQVIPTRINCLNDAKRIASGGFHYMIVRETIIVDSVDCFEEYQEQ